MAKNEAERMQVFLRTRQAILDGNMGAEKAVETMVEAGWEERSARFHVDAWYTVSTLRLMQGERKRDPVRVVRVQMTDLGQMAKLLNIPNVSEEASDG
jgi:hypothetical protein